MKMQELIGEFRKEMPELAETTEKSREECRRAMTLFHDFDKCESQEAKTVLVDTMRTTLARFYNTFGRVGASVDRLAELNAGYTRVLGPRKPKAEDPNQMKLGFTEGEEES